jgi:hypothetical protein
MLKSSYIIENQHIIPYARLQLGNLLKNVEFFSFI